MWPKPFTITLNDDSEHDFAECLAHVIEYWQEKYFAEELQNSRDKEPPASPE
jgi:hypothetical protein